MGKSIKEILKIMKENNVKFLRLQFVDLFGVTKNVELPESQFERALNGEVMFDGSSVEGMVRIEESDMLLEPDLETFIVFPWETLGWKTARIICNINKTDGTPFEGCPRNRLKLYMKKAAELGLYMNAGPEPEFFLFKKDSNGNPTTIPNDNGGYFDLAPLDEAESVRTQIVIFLQNMGFEVEAAHHEVAEGQHEIDFRFDNPLKTADNINTFKFIVKKIAAMNGLFASFLPKPIKGINGSGMHVHQSLSDAKGNNLFYDKNKKYQLSDMALYYINGIIEHAPSFVAITNPIVNSYKRLVPGHEAPVNIAWSMKNRSPLIRIPDKRENGTRIEVRVPDPATNPYLALLVMFASGVDGINKKVFPPEAISENVFELTEKEKKKLRVGALPANIFEAVENLKKDKYLREILGEHIFNHFYEAKLKEWDDFNTEVHNWEIKRYLSII